jgi:hypothetical protein
MGLRLKMKLKAKLKNLSDKFLQLLASSGAWDPGPVQINPSLISGENSFSSGLHCL